MNPAGLHAADAGAAVRGPPLNEFYGHAAVLRAYSGVPDRRPIRGRLQHGWTPALEISDDRCDRYFPWGDRGMRALRDRQVPTSHIDPIGSPWIYLPRVDRPRPTRQTLVFPQHSTDQRRLPSAYWRSFAAWATECRPPTTVCLHPQDAWARRILPLGVIGQTAGRVLDAEYLAGLRRLIWDHAEVVSPIFQTAALYARAEGVPVRQGGPIAMSDGPGECEWRFYVEYGEAVSFGLDPAEEVGVRYKRSPEGLRRLLWLEGI